MPTLTETIINKAANKIIDDPVSALAAADGALNLAMNLAPTMPWEFPLPVPRIIYDKLNLDKYAQKSITHT